MSRLLHLVFAALLGASLILAAPASAPTLAAEVAPFSPEQKMALEQLIRDYLLAHPEVVLEALDRMESKQAEPPAPGQLAELKTSILGDPASPVANPSGAIPVVEFFDYRCGYCKKMLPDIQRLRKEAKDVRLVFKELPILTPDSIVAARAALAARNQAQEKYEAYHFALMDTKGAFTEERLLQIGKTVGLDPERLKRDMADPKIEAEIDANLALAKRLNIRGTPSLIIGDTLVPGAIGYEQMIQLVEKARASCRMC